MKEFKVTVNNFSVVIKETNNLRHYHFKAVVDGESYRYKILNEGESVCDNSGGTVLKKEVFGRASIEIMYHAHNAGNIVRFEPVGNVRSKKKKKISKNQMTMFEEKHKYE